MQDNREVMEMVREQLGRRSPPSVPALYGRAVRIDPSIRELSLRQFNARFPLQVRREKARRRASADGRRQRVAVDRDAVREVLLRFAREVAAADGTAAVIDTLTHVDSYVDEIMTAAAP